MNELQTQTTQPASTRESAETAVLTLWNDIMKSFDDIYESSKREDKNVDRH